MPYGGGLAPIKTIDTIDPILDRWPSASAKLAKDMLGVYGLPHEATSSMLVWHYNDPWKRTILWRDGVHHSFPRSHLDLLEQTLDYRIPLEKIGQLGMYNGSVVVARTRGEISVCCGSQMMNFLVMNLTHEIIIGRLTPEQARIRHREVISGMRLHWPEPYTQGLTFSLPAVGYGTGESDESVRNILWPFQNRKH
jgi:hypothetical protein